jgi:hypothetical protein
MKREEGKTKNSTNPSVVPCRRNPEQVTAI